jgi:hypothetical protein
MNSRQSAHGGGKVSLSHQPPLRPPPPPINIPGTNFCLRLSRRQGHSATGNYENTIGIRTCDLPVCSATLQPTVSPRSHLW